MLDHSHIYYNIYYYIRQAHMWTWCVNICVLQRHSKFCCIFPHGSILLFMEKLKKKYFFCDIILKYSTNFNQYIRKKDPQNAFFSKYVQIMFNNTKNRYIFIMLKQSTPNHLLTQRVRQTSITLFHKFSHVLLPFFCRFLAPHHLINRCYAERQKEKKNTAKTVNAHEKS